MLIIDPLCPVPYTSDTLNRETSGGTEATVIRLLRAMPEAVVMQHNRTEIEEPHAQYRPLDWSALPESGPIVVLRRWDYAFHVRALGWNGPVYLWLHDLTGVGLGLSMPALATAKIGVIAVSQWHLDHVLGQSKSMFGPYDPMPEAMVIPNPLEPSLRPGPATRDPDRLIYISSPHKGLADVVEHFQALRKRHPKLELSIAKSGSVKVDGVAGIKVLGDLIHGQAMNEISQSFCMFYPNMGYPETFGIVYAEANALGTPVIAHDFGSAREVLADERQLVNGYDSAQVIARYESWRDGDWPEVKARPEFAIDKIVPIWRGLA